jgi:hypothetical protein
VTRLRAAIANKRHCAVLGSDLGFAQIQLQLVPVGPNVPAMRPFYRPYSTANPPPPGGAPPRPATLRARPLLFISTFLVFHQAVATGSLFPAYAFFSSTDASTALLAGPTTAYVLKQRVPWPLSRGGEDRTVADVVEDGIRASVKGGFGAYRRWKENKATKATEVEHEDVEALQSHGVLRRALARARGTVNTADAAPLPSSSDLSSEENSVDASKTRWRDRLADYRAKRAEARTASADEAIADSAVDGLEGRQDWKGRLADGASNVRMKHVMDFAAAYLVVKVRLSSLAEAHFLSLRPTYGLYHVWPRFG